MKLRRNKEEIINRYINIVSDYNAGLTIKQIKERNKCSTGLIYYALNKKLEDVKL